MKINFAFMLVVTILLLFLYSAAELFLPARQISRNLEIEIPKGTTFRQAVELLQNQNLIRDRRIFLIAARLTGSDRKIRAGYYSLWTGMSPFDILRVLLKGKIVEYEVRILEGDSLPEIAEAFARTGIISSAEFLELAKDPDILAQHGILAPSREGYIFPDTYTIPKGMDAREAVDAMIVRMREKYGDKLAARAREIGMTENQVLTLASIIEKEAVIDSERSVISAVYHNRLRKNMPLQADPTSIYGVKSSKEKITLNDLKRQTPYNTYRIKGLPPGPIASPGLKSIIAALYPDNVPYLYFVAQDDRSHRFAESEKDHAENVRLYRAKQQEMKNSPKEGSDEKTPS
ncbi:MAG TPA: endolytic transglycosylase MltG [Thermodesulfovibrionales bacterium]|nr:endolytic transglycosylase MltG [Thermodesulfovibrionales bacterium]